MEVNNSNSHDVMPPELQDPHANTGMAGAKEEDLFRVRGDGDKRGRGRRPNYYAE